MHGSRTVANAFYWNADNNNPGKPTASAGVQFNVSFHVNLTTAYMSEGE